MVSITLPENNQQERQYIVYTLFNDFLGIDCEISISDTAQDYIISFDNSELIIRDSFFKNYPKAYSYLKASALPGNTLYTRNTFTIERDIPIIYGSEELVITENRIVCGIDIFASAFFMLSRWEEFVNKTRDEHYIFPASASTSYTNGFFNRPVVNEYVEMLWELMQRLGYKGTRKIGDFEIVLTHDIDHLDYPRTFRILLGDIVKRKQVKLALDHLNTYLKTGLNPYDSFDFIMTCSERLNLKSHFYFMAANTNQIWDKPFYLTSRRFKEKIKEIKTRGHVIGFHPGYYTCNDEELWKAEKNRLEQAVHQKIVEGRQHYLRFEIPLTYRIWESNNMEIDSSLGDNHHEGYRCGTGDSFTVFDFLERKRLKIRERPLIIMDGNFSSYTPEYAIEVIRSYIASAKKYRSALTLLFHNSTFYGENWKGYDSIYRKSLGL